MAKTISLLALLFLVGCVRTISIPPDGYEVNEIPDGQRITIADTAGHESDAVFHGSTKDSLLAEPRFFSNSGIRRIITKSTGSGTTVLGSNPLKVPLLIALYGLGGRSILTGLSNIVENGSCGIAESITRDAGDTIGRRIELIALADKALAETLLLSLFSQAHLDEPIAFPDGYPLFRAYRP